MKTPAVAYPAAKETAPLYTARVKKVVLTGFLLGATASAAPLCSAAQTLAGGKGGYIETTTHRLLYYGGFFSNYNLTLLKAPMKRLKEAFAKRGIELLVMPVPHTPMIYGDELDPKSPALANFPIAKGYSAKSAQKNYQTMINEMKALGLNPINLLPTILAFKPGASGEPFYYLNDLHWTSSGADASAQVAAKEIKRLYPKLYASFPRNEIDLSSAGTFPNTGFSPAIQKACGGEWPVPQGQLLKVTPKSTDGVGLLDDTAVPIILFGDSFFGPNRNFDFFLHKYLAVDVLNAGISGGAFYDSMMNYFVQAQPGDSTPKIALWEYLNTLPPPDQFRQLIPAVYGECADGKSVARGNTADTTRTPARVDIPASTKISGSKYFAYFKADDLGLVNFEIKVEYRGGKSEVIPVARSSRIKNNGRYFVEFTDTINDPVQRVTLLAPGGIKGGIQGKVCAKQ